MAANASKGSAGPARTTPRSDIAIGAGAVGLAVVAALAAQMGAPKAQPLVGAVVILGIAYAFSTNRAAIDRRTVAWGLGLQIAFAWLVLTRPTGQRVFQILGAAINRLLGFAGVGAAFVFGPLGDRGVWGRVMTGALGPDGPRYAGVFAFP